ncbi:MAG: penicillin-insensitive murein endopeptidase [Candidatus Woesearchaeota archaeon]|jgi:hypothetical protein
MIKKTIATGLTLGLSAFMLNYYLKLVNPSYDNNPIEHKAIASEQVYLEPPHSLDLKLVPNQISSLEEQVDLTLLDVELSPESFSVSLNPFKVPLKRVSSISDYCKNLTPYPIARGIPQRGRLLNGILLQENQNLRPFSGQSYGTCEIVQTLKRSAQQMRERYDIKLIIGSLSKKQGGLLRTNSNGRHHTSHQNGLDVDVGICRYHHEQYDNAFQALRREERTPQTYEANWFFIRTVQQEFQIEAIYWDKREIERIKKHVYETHGMGEWTKYGEKLMPWTGHQDHFHIRIKNPRDLPEYHNFKKIS